MTSPSLNDLARAAYTRHTQDKETARISGQAKAREEFLALARATANSYLGNTPAADLVWEYTPWTQTPPDTEEATAALAPGPRHDYALVYSYNAGTERSEFALRVTCTGCGCATTTEVTSIEHLGQLLVDDVGRADEHPDSEEDGARSAAADLHEFTTRLSGLVRQLTTRYPDAGLIVDRALARSYNAGDSSGEVHLRADSAEAAVEIAASFGVDAGVRTHGSPTGLGTYAFRNARAEVTVDGIELHLSGTTQLSDAEASAWMAGQEAADGDQPDGITRRLAPTQTLKDDGQNGGAR
ncbi:DUF6195 family protein [Streptomyces griseoviridis]